MANIILASKSTFRASLLKNAGIKFGQVAAEIDERSIEQPLIDAGNAPTDIAEMLAVAKASHVSESHIDHYIIGSDQILELEGEMLHKPKDMEAARRRLLELSGKTHSLHSAVAIVRNEEILWSTVETADIAFRDLSPEFVGRHLADAGDTILQSVGAYQIEGVGVQLFKELEGDFFTIMGLPLITLLDQLRNLEIIEG